LPDVLSACGRAAVALAPMSHALGLKQLASATSDSHYQVPHLRVLWLEIDGEAMASQRFAAHGADRGDDHAPRPVDHGVRETELARSHHHVLYLSPAGEEHKDHAGCREPRNGSLQWSSV